METQEQDCMRCERTFDAQGDEELCPACSKNPNRIDIGKPNFTPRTKDGHRLSLILSDADLGKLQIRNRDPWKATVTDCKTGRVYQVHGAECSSPACFCDAVAVLEKERTLAKNGEYAREHIQKMPANEAKGALLEIFLAMDGEHWGGDVCQAVADVFSRLEIEFVSPDDLEDES